MNRPDLTTLPPYTHVPGITPHPISDPAGHLRNVSAETPETPPEQMLAHGVFLFNHGFYWEAHEAWEHLWISLGRSGNEANIVKGLIKLAACGVKCLEANAAGAKRHAERAAELLDVTGTPDWLDLNMNMARQVAVHASQHAPILHEISDGTPQRLPEFHLPGQGPASK